jgi:hypothetical protein
MKQESYAEFHSKEIRIRLGFKLKATEVCAGGPVQGCFIMENQGSKPVYFSASMPNNRPAYMSFRATAPELELTLKDPLNSDPLMHGPVIGAVVVPPASSRNRIIILNQFLNLEELLRVLEPGQSTILMIHWRYFLVVGLSAQTAIPSQGQPPVLEGDLKIKVVRDDQRLDTMLECLTNSIKHDWTVISQRPVERMLDVTALTSLRIPAAIPYLRSIVDHPDPEVSIYVRVALHARSVQSDLEPDNLYSRSEEKEQDPWKTEKTIPSDHGAV